MPELPLPSLVACLLVVACGASDHPPPLGDLGAFDAGRTGSGGRRASGGTAGRDAGNGDAQTGGTSGGGRSSSGGAGGAAAADSGPDADSDGASAGGSSAGGSSAGGSGALPEAGAGGSGSVACTAGTFIGPADAFSQTDLSALAGYTTITGDLYIGSSIAVPRTNVTSLAALDCLETVTGEVTILDSPLLTSLAGLESLASATALKIIATGLGSLDGLGQLAVSDVLLVQDCPALTTLTSGVASVGSLAIRDNVLLPQCTVDTFAARLGATSACTCSGNTGVCP